MRVPENIKIGGVDYKVNIEQNLRNAAVLLYGEIDFENCHIRLSGTDGLGEERRQITFLHEVLHGILWHYWSGDPVEEEEKIVTALAKGLFQVLKDNENCLFREVGKKINRT